MNRVDLHLHTTASDGELSPQEIVDFAIKKGLRAIAITDHDTIKGAAKAVEYAKNKKIEVIPGIEISCYEKEMGFEEVHITGLFIDLKSRKLRSFTEKIRLARIEQKKQIIKNLNKLGFKIKFAEVKSLADFSIGRPHIAQVLIKKYPHKFRSVKEVFDQYIGVGRPAYHEREDKVRIVDAIKVIKEARGISILSHPGVYRKEDSLELIRYFLKCGGEGIETFYPYDIICGLSTKRSEGLNRYYNALAKRMKILQSGGSDFHGSSRKKVKAGHFDIEYNIVEEIKKEGALGKTKVLFIFPPLTVDSSDYPSPDPPLGLAYLAAVLERDKFPVKILDALALGIERAKRKKGGFLKVGLSKKEIKKVVADFQPHLVGVSCGSTANAPDSHEVAAWVKEVDPKILVAFGGAHATACAPLVLKDKNVDLVVLGEGELAFLELANCLERKKDLSLVQSTAQRKKGKIIVNPRRDYIANLDDLPDPARHLLPMEVYLQRQTKTREFSMRTPRTNIITSRGCPGNCVFCSIHAIWGHRWRPRSPERVVAEIEHSIKTYGIKEFYVLDDSISIDQKRLVKICDLICKKGLDIRWAAPNGIAIWTLDKQVLKKMKKSGFYRITFGIESGCPKTLRFIRKPIILEKAKKMIDVCNNLGLWTHSTFIIGFPQETREDIEETIDWAADSGLDFATFYIATPYPGTDLRQEFIKESLLKESKEEKMRYSSINVAGYGTKHFTAEELNRLRDEAYSRFFTAQVRRFLNPFYSLPHLARKINSWEKLVYFFRILNNVLGMKVQSLLTGKFQTHSK